MATDEIQTEQTSTGQSETNSVLIKIGVLLAIVLAIQVTVVLMFVNPQVSGPAEIIGDPSLIAEESESIGDNIDEVEIGSFQCANTTAIPSSIVHVNFKLCALVTRAKKDLFKDTVNGASNKRVREAVEKVARSATLDDLNDASLNSIKLQIKEEINRVLRKSYVEQSIIYDFTIMEQ